MWWFSRICHKALLTLIPSAQKSVSRAETSTLHRTPYTPALPPRDSSRNRPNSALTAVLILPTISVGVFAVGSEIISGEG